MTTKQFYLLCLIGITFVGGMIMLLLWRQIKLKSSENRGMLFISLAMFSWTLVGLYKYSDPPMPSLINAINDRILSAFSNLFLLASLPYFPNVFESWREKFTVFRKPEQWVNAVFLFFAVVTVFFTIIDRSVESDAGRKAIIAIDSLISTVTITLISYTIFVSISRFWTDRILKNFLILMFIVIGSTQVILPMIAIFPEVLKPFYLGALVHLLIGMTFFNFISVAYFGMVNMEMTVIAREEKQKVPTVSSLPQHLWLGYDRTRDGYIVRLEFGSPGSKDHKTVEVHSAKLLQPFANWVLFALARKHSVKLMHSDLSTTKFRMVEFWNRDAEVKLTQDMLFSNDRGQFEFKIPADQIEIHDLPFLHSKYIIREAVLKHEDSFRELLKSDGETATSKTIQQERLQIRVFGL
jgi:hypothetical protein